MWHLPLKLHYFDILLKRNQFISYMLHTLFFQISKHKYNYFQGKGNITMDTLTQKNYPFPNFKKKKLYISFKKLDARFVNVISRQNPIFQALNFLQIKHLLLFLTSYHPTCINLFRKLEFVFSCWCEMFVLKLSNIQ